MTYELWDSETNNLMAAYGEERDALRAVRIAIMKGGPQSVTGVALIREDPHGMSHFVASGDELAMLAKKTSSTSA